ncbi:fibronectin type III domain-containing protein [Phycicoccus duodecadis]|uniref:Fibronectin type III domain protein n=1 Tax=Phycicoccus duodecadis TaxID=173053 RepID=A0A2N3YKK2_9MICO|nr:fibronectin type III domain-containing protein [Phycicoccus duodecadis]PKW27393.1 fibronectin type III domain protein [Phycicoccus duodecadis]
MTGARLRVVAALVVASVLGPLAASVGVAAEAPHALHPATLAAGPAETLPTPPVVASVAGDALSVAVSWLPAPEGAGVTSYTLTAHPGEGVTTSECPQPADVTASAAGGSSATWVTGLCARVPYVVQMTATNSAGTSGPSAPSQPGVPVAAQAPRAPAVLGALGRDGRVVVSWAAPALDGGRPVTGYVVSATDPGGVVRGTATLGPTSSEATLTGLQNGVVHTVDVVATNDVGASSAGSTEVTPRAAYAPSVPRGLVVAPDGTGGVDVSWQAPLDDGGSSISGYVLVWQRVVRSPDGSYDLDPVAPQHTQSLAGDVTAASVSTFEDAAASYRFELTATTVAGSGTAATSAAVRPTVVLAARTLVLDDVSAGAVAAVSPDTVEWAQPAPSQVVSITPGTVIVAAATPGTPTGLLRRVTTVESTADHLVLRTVEAALDDVFDDVTVSAVLDPTRATAAGATPAPGVRPTFQAAVPGVRAVGVEPGAGVSVSNTLRLDLELEDDDIFVSGTAAVSTEVGLEMGVSKNAVGAPAGVRLDVTGKVGLSVAARFGVRGDKKVTLGTVEGVPFTVMAGPVPIVVQPRLVSTLSLSGELSLGVKGTAQTGAAVHWDSTDPYVLDVKDISKPFGASGGAVPGVTVDGKASIALKFQAIAAIAGVVGPSVSVTAKLAGSVDFNVPTGGHFLEVAPSLELKGGVALNRFGFSLELERALAVRSFVAFVIDRPPTATYTVVGPTQVPAGTPTTFEAVRSDGVVEPLDWSIVGGVGADAVDSDGRVVAANPAGRTVTVHVDGASGASGERVVLVGTPFGAPVNLRVQRHAADFGIDASWEPPPTTGGSAVTGYLAVLRSDTGESTTSRTTQPVLSVADLAPGAWTVEVFAQNADGRLSTPARTSIIITPLCTTRWAGGPDGRWTDPSSWSSGRVPGPADWVCLGGSDARLAPDETATVAGLDGEQGTLVLDGQLTVGSHLDGLQLMDGAGTFTAGPALRWTLPQNLDVDVVNRGRASLSTSAPYTYLNHDVRFDNYGTLTTEGTDGGWLGDQAGSESRVVNHPGATLSLTGGVHVWTRVVLDGTIRSDGPSSWLHLAVLADTARPALDGRVSLDTLEAPTEGAQVPGVLSGATVSTIEGGPLTVPAGVSLTVARQEYREWDLALHTLPSIMAPEVRNHGRLTLDGRSQAVRLTGARVANDGDLVLRGSAPTDPGSTDSRISNLEGGTLRTEGATIDLPTDLAGAVVNTSATTTLLRSAQLAGPTSLDVSGDVLVPNLQVPGAGATLVTTGDRLRLSQITGGPLSIGPGSRLDLTSTFSDASYPCRVSAPLTTRGDLRLGAGCWLDDVTNEGTLSVTGDLGGIVDPARPMLTNRPGATLSFTCPVRGCFVTGLVVADGTLRNTSPRSVVFSRLDLLGSPRVEVLRGQDGEGRIESQYELTLRGSLVATNEPGYTPAPWERWTPVLGTPVLGGFEAVLGDGWRSVATSPRELEWPGQELAFTQPGTPTVDAHPVFGQPMTAGAGSWQPQPDTVEYVWLRAGEPIPGATEATYVPSLDDLGAPLSVRVTARKVGYLTAVRTSSSSSPVGPATASAPAPAMLDACASAQDLVHIPGSQAAAYTMNGRAVDAGAYGATGTVTVTARARPGYVLTGTTSWTRTFVAAACTTVLTAPAFATPTYATPQVGLSWAVGGLPAGAGPVTFLVSSRVVGVTATGARTYSTPVSRLTTSRGSGVLTGVAGAVYQFQVRAVDAYGMQSLPSPWRTVTMPTDDRATSLSWSTGWAKGVSSSYYAGTYRITKVRATVRATAWTDQVTLIGARTRTSGKLAVYVDGVLRLTVDSSGSTTSLRQSLGTVTVPYGRHVVVVTALATPGRPTVILDALAFRR